VVSSFVVLSAGSSSDLPHEGGKFGGSYDYCSGSSGFFLQKRYQIAILGIITKKVIIAVQVIIFLYPSVKPFHHSAI